MGVTSHLRPSWDDPPGAIYFSIGNQRTDFSRNSRSQNERLRRDGIRKSIRFLGQKKQVESMAVSGSPKKVVGII